MRPHTPTWFSLIELLVVIAIIAWFVDGHVGKLTESYLVEKNVRFFDSLGIPR